jgi:hypothetical protein
MDIVDINKKIKTEICYNSIEKLNDKNLLNEYKECKSVKKKISGSEIFAFFFLKKRNAKKKTKQSFAPLKIKTNIRKT